MLTRGECLGKHFLLLIYISYVRVEALGVWMHFQTSLAYAQRIVVPSSVVKHLCQPNGGKSVVRVEVPGAFNFPRGFIEPRHSH